MNAPKRDPQDEPDVAGGPRAFEVAVEVPGTPEEVWEAISTGPGITAWFVPAEVDPGVGGTITQFHGDGISAPPSRIVAWDPPHRLVLDDGDWQPTPTSPQGRIATEYLVEARSGGACVVRLVTSGFGSGDEWDRAREGTAHGWRTALETLRLYLTHFRGEPLAAFAANAVIPGDRSEAARALQTATGVAGRREGDEVRTAPPVPELAGTVEYATAEQVIVRLGEPGRGLAFIATGGPGDETYAFVRLKLFGPGGQEVADRDQPRWQAWIDDLAAATA